ncbi:Golgin subfamily A member 7/ERF4 family-domain-containing protein [Radiomyces spectabilis]|uniref:Golgin subfamily A member 7/ERF4 family-domain-containing protein n=1 Tax=Radiomyces spectabilis TaxID=64574 RepID=UPI00222001BB|nr:Golgin subfamily A member 7/ERF4 family-domain-containing protein [Radiomyces spectabilis]KAI8371455.1 Golgin subfamily A member 7/ERF4 family-domain-containing protein [Radiomyces spectabilis]
MISAHGHVEPSSLTYRRKYTDVCVHPSPPSPRISRRRHSSTASYPSTLVSYHRKNLSVDAIPLISNPTEHSLSQTISNIKIAFSRHSSSARDLAYSSMINNHVTSARHFSSFAPTTVDSTNCHSHHNAMATKPMSLQPSSTPHTDNHETIDMALHAPSHTIRVERDYSQGDGITRFSTEFPAELLGRISLEEFQRTIDTINATMDRAERLSLSIIFDNIMEILTIYTWPIFFSSHYQRSLDQLLRFIDSENENVYHPKGMSISNPVKAAFLFLEIKLYSQ